MFSFFTSAFRLRRRAVAASKAASSEQHIIIHVVAAPVPPFIVVMTRSQHRAAADGAQSFECRDRSLDWSSADEALGWTSEDDSDADGNDNGARFVAGSKRKRRSAAEERKTCLYHGRAAAASRNVTHVHLSRHVETIHKRAFHSRDRLVRVNLCGGSLVRIEDGAFIGCVSLKHVEFPPTLRVIGGAAFYSCRELERVGLCDGLEVIGRNAFCDCQSLKLVGVPSTVRNIGKSAFRNCVNLKAVTLHEGITQIRDETFYRCTSLQSITIPSTVFRIGEYAFRDCHRLETMELCTKDNHTSHCKGLKYIGRRAFFHCEALRCIILPLTVSVIRDQAFSDCYSLVSVEFCGTLDIIASLVFFKCKSLQKISFPETLTGWDEIGYNEIGYQAFGECASLRDIATPQGLTQNDLSLSLRHIRGCYDLLDVFDGSVSKLNSALAMRYRFNGLPLHKLCYYQSCYSTDELIEELKSSLDPKVERSQDCLGMTPLHILACSAQHNLGVYQHTYCCQGSKQPHHGGQMGLHAAFLCN